MASSNVAVSGTVEEQAFRPAFGAVEKGAFSPCVGDRLIKSGDSYLRERKGDEAEIFRIKDDRHVRYWTVQAFPVMLVIRNSQREIRWMDVSTALKNAAGEVKQGEVKQIVFHGERFDVMSVRGWAR